MISNNGTNPKDKEGHSQKLPKYKDPYIYKGDPKDQTPISQQVSS